MKRIKQRVKERVGRNRSGVRDIKVLIEDLDPLLRGWGNYFCTGNAAKKFNQVHTYVWSRLHGFMVKRKGRNVRPGDSQQWNRDFFHPSDCTAWAAPSLPGGSMMPARERRPESRVREIRTHGLKGGLTEMTATHRESEE